jgi:hypothetical protein
MLKLPPAILSAMKSLSGSLQGKPCINVKSELKKIREDLNKEVVEVSEGLRQYANLVDSYYSQCPPFGSGSNENDYQDFIELIGHSVIIGNYTLLEKWAIQYPRKNPKRLAQPLASYAAVFCNITKSKWEETSQIFKWPPQAKMYCEYLVQSWTP